jgi:hypothetical protein
VMLTNTPSNLADRREANSMLRCCFRKDVRDDKAVC